MRTSSVTRRFISATLIIVIGVVIGFSPLIPAKKAEAQLIVAESGIQLGLQIKQTVIMDTLNALAWAAAKATIQSMTQSIVNWINSGFEGSPAFITDLNENLGNLADAVAEDFIDGLDQVIIDNTGFSIQSPFQDQIASALREEFYRTTSSYGFDVRNPYTLGNYSDDPEAFTKGDFSKGGFDAWFQLSQNRANNPYGRYMLARDELWRSVDAASKNRREELDWGNGFLSWRGPCGPNSNPPAGGAASLDTKEANYGCRIRTPGSLIEDQLVQSLGSPIRQLEIADSINEIVAALMTQMVNQVLGGGGLSGLSQPSSGGGSSFVDRATSVSASLGSGFLTTLSQQRTQITEYQAAWQRIASAASAAQQVCSGDSRQNEANTVLALANQRINEATAVLSGLATIEQQARALQTSGSSDSSAIANIVNAYTSLISSTGTLAEGPGQSSGTEGSLYSQMVNLAEECR